MLSKLLLACWLIFAKFILDIKGVDASVFGDYIAGRGGGGGRLGGLEKEQVPEYLRSVVDCQLGEPHRHYHECRCGERVEIVPDTEIPSESRGDYHVRVKHTRRGTRHIFYHCLFCSQCPDGVRTLSNCSKMVDTQCTSSCIRSTDYFDKGRKACIPDPRFEESATQQVDTTVNQGDNSFVSEMSEKKHQLQSPENIPSGPSSGRSSVFLADEKSFLIVGWAIVIAVVIVLIVNIFICKFFYHRRKDDQLTQGLRPHRQDPRRQ